MPAKPQDTYKQRIGLIRFERIVCKISDVFSRTNKQLKKLDLLLRTILSFKKEKKLGHMLFYACKANASVRFQISLFPGFSTELF